jgi:hypothetical protein
VYQEPPRGFFMSVSVGALFIVVSDLRRMAWDV